MSIPMHAGATAAARSHSHSRLVTIPATEQPSAPVTPPPPMPDWVVPMLLLAVGLFFAALFTRYRP